MDRKESVACKSDCESLGSEMFIASVPMALHFRNMNSITLALTVIRDVVVMIILATFSISAK